jgi:hypothetical protein
LYRRNGNFGIRQDLSLVHFLLHARNVSTRRNRLYNTPPRWDLIYSGVRKGKHGVCNVHGVLFEWSLYYIHLSISTKHFISSDILNQPVTSLKVGDDDYGMWLKLFRMHHPQISTPSFSPRLTTPFPHLSQLIHFDSSARAATTTAAELHPGATHNAMLVDVT